MDNEERKKINMYAKIYRDTKSLSEFLEQVEFEVGGRASAQEAEIAWEAIDQWEGEWRPDEK